jgi:hypothetical protein
MGTPAEPDDESVPGRPPVADVVTPAPDAPPDAPPPEPEDEVTLYVGPRPASLPSPLPALSSAVSFQPCCASRASESGAESSFVAPDVSVVLVVVEWDGCLEVAALGFPAPKESDSAASESDVTTPTASSMACLEAGSFVTLGVS